MNKVDSSNNSAVLSLSKKGDCLNTIRLIAALQVVIGHTTRWLEIPIPDVLSKLLLLVQGVPVFFMLSGFLIWFSIGRSHSFKEYALKRFWRLYPELWVAVLVELIVIIIMYDHPIEWGKLLLFGISEGSVCIWIPEFLKDYGTGAPNGVLWTMFCLMKFYIIGYFLYKLLHGHSTKRWLTMLSLLIFMGHFSTYVSSLGIPKITFLYQQTTLPFLWLFMLGAFCAEKWNLFYKVVGGAKYWLSALIIAIFSIFTGYDINCSDPDFGYYLIRSIAMLIWILGFAYAFPAMNLKKDISYPVYLYHMTVVQVFYILGYRQNILILFLVIGITLFVSFLSTISVGNWSGKMKKKMA